VSLVIWDPSILIMYRDAGFNGEPPWPNTTCEPSGETSGLAASTAAGVRRRLFDPSVFMIQIAETNPPFWLA
jgi:hypothetical protein